MGEEKIVHKKSTKKKTKKKTAKENSAQNSSTKKIVQKIHPRKKLGPQKICEIKQCKKKISKE